ncbi:Na(+)/H(+) antiporter NhaA 2 [Plantactinospora endophytica]|uniref:Na(+)/H(+) antiporter NhaA n=1 Tax=Plantactinospora endophytica TaxID=673535 RepID=A0ABQ4E143_9ACTN|nr:Na(+)/H(+) antiporter NhaA 2 [Plantactinospora endophytica]
MRRFARTESGSAGVLVLAIVAALVWANVSEHSYEAVWGTELSIRIDDVGVAYDLRTWVNSGLMTLFFLVVGLEARREFDLGDLRDRRRFALPLAAGVFGMAVPVAIYLLVNRGGSGAHGWGVAMSTDTALALGLITLLGRNVPDQVRIFLLTVFVVDDLVALVVIAVVYTEHVDTVPLLVAIGLFAVLLGLRALGVRRGLVYLPFCVALWAALLASGVEPVVAGLAIGLTATAYSPARGALETASGLFKLFREQPTAELARSATLGLSRSLSPNDRLQRMYHPWSSYLIVPLFGLANAGIALDAAFLARAFTTPVTLGILLGYVVGKPVAVLGVSWLVERASGGRIRPSVGWAGVLASGTISGIGFTLSLLIATLAFQGDQLAEAKVGVLAAGLVASLLTWTVFRITQALPKPQRTRALLGDADQLVDLVPPVDHRRDHVRGPADASVTVVEYGDFQCPYCGQAEPVVRELLTDADLRYVWRHLPLTDVHPQAQLAAEAAEAAAAQGAFWEMHDLLLDHQDGLRTEDLVGYAGELGLDQEQFQEDLATHDHAARVAHDVESADVSGVSGTPTFFINDRRHYGAYDIETLTRAIKVARARARLEPRRNRRADRR